MGEEMREIKFRAWDKKWKEMFPCCFFNGELPNIILMQYTGLKDKNKKEIYEGDLIQVSDIGIAEVVYGFHITSKDDWSVEHGTMGFTLKWIGTDDHSELQSSKDLEIIGNIYENPELAE